jgi:hypothetical protein
MGRREIDEVVEVGGPESELMSEISSETIASHDRLR